MLNPLIDVGTQEVGVFTRYVRGLEPGGEPDPADFEVTYDALRGVLYWELRRRGLWLLPPRYLGIDGFARWTESDGRRGLREDALFELTADAYSHIFVERLASLHNHLKVKPNIDGLVFRQVGHFVSERQSLYDPLGTRLYSVLKTAIGESLEDPNSGLRIVAGTFKHLGRAILATRVDADSASASPPDRLWLAAGDWNSELLPELMTARGAGYPKLIARVRKLLAALSDQGIEVFAFKTLADILKADLRSRWRDFHDASLGEKGVESLEDGRRHLVRQVPPSTTFEERDSFRKLVACIEQGIAERGSVGSELRLIWRLILGWAGDEGDSSVPEELAPSGDLPPSRRAIAREFGIPRDRLPRLYEVLGSLLEICRKTLGLSGR